MEIQNQLHIKTVKKMDTYSESLDSKSVTVSSVNSISSPPFPELLEHYAWLRSEMHSRLTREKAVLNLQNNIAFIYQIL